jgi:hypothetical protein
MSTNARTWFYREPEHIPYAVVERLNGTFWGARITQLLITECTRAEPPFVVRGFWREQPIELEWQPQAWLALRAGGAQLDDLIGAIGRILGFKPAFRYQDGDDRSVVEWHRDRALEQSRWQAIQGRPAYSQPQRLSTP